MVKVPKTAVDAAALRAALAGAVTGKGDITTHALLRADDGKLTITTTDTRVTVARTILARFGEKWEATAEADSLQAALNGLEGEIELVRDETSLRLAQGRRRFNLPSLDPAGFPLPLGNKAKPVETDRIALRAALAHVGYAAAKNRPDAPYLNGLLIGTEHIVASNGHRLALAPISGFKSEHIVPVQSVRYCEAAIESGSSIAAGDGEIVIENEANSLRARLLDAKWPDYKHMIPALDSFKSVFRFAAAEMSDAINRLLPLCTNYGAIVLEIENGAMRLSPDRDDGSVDIVAGERTKGEGEMHAVMSARYLLDVLRLAQDDAIAWRHSGAMAIQAFTFGSDEKPRADMHYIMPVARR